MVRPLQKRILCALSAILLVFGTGSPTLAKSGTSVQQQVQLGITGVRVGQDGSSLSFDTNRPFSEQETRYLSVVKFPAPYRLMVEIPHARLMTGRTTYPINRNGIDHVELSDSHSPFYNSVRALIFVDDSQVLAKLTPSFEGNTLKITGLPVQKTELAQQSLPVSEKPAQPLGKAQPLPPVAKPFPSIAVSAASQPVKATPLPVPDTPVAASPVNQQQTILSKPVPAGTNIIEEAYLQDDRLIIKGQPGSKLRVKNRFLLTEPNRLVLDLENSVLRSKTLMNPMEPQASNEVRQIRLGQFDESTVRIVIEGLSPERYEAIYTGSDHSLLTICPYSTNAITKLSANTRIGRVESIDLSRQNGTTVLRLEASAPIVHRFVKKDDRVVLDLLNATANPTPITVDSSKYPEVARMHLEPLMQGQPNSKLAITLASPNVRVTPSISENGKVLELTLAQEAGSIALGAAGNAPFPARVVLDAGHGGKDLGANRDGVNEKDLNLTLAHMVREALEAKGIKVYMTRSTDVFLPLPEITAITNRIKPDLFISIHHNASVNPALHGIETYYYTPQSLALAKRVHARKINAVQAKDGGVKRAMFYVIHHTNVPAILCEVGYISNPDERNALQTYERRIKTARAIADGVVDYLKASVSAQAKSR